MNLTINCFLWKKRHTEWPCATQLIEAKFSITPFVFVLNILLNGVRAYSLAECTPIFGCGGSR